VGRGGVGRGGMGRGGVGRGEVGRRAVHLQPRAKVREGQRHSLRLAHVAGGPG